ncbi:Uncharacterised protein [Starkeya nomas]|uniref:Uncharacterized protein n=2 Tax=Starkeya nomas TaxID=2666134 RepID=A0A5S9R420_9HYPH|nr:Uncharacterised protein [Starkeya nomas]
MYVIGRLAPDHPSGCVYWDGWTKVEGGPDIPTFSIGEAGRHEDVRVFGSADIAAGLALWLNTSPALKRNPLAPLWRAMPIPAEFGSAA